MLVMADSYLSFKVQALYLFLIFEENIIDHADNLNFICYSEERT
jgi:hypothetical protein